MESSPDLISIKVRIWRGRARWQEEDVGEIPQSEMAARSGWQEYQVTLPASAFVLDALEEIQKQDPSLLFRHACHHASCGSCGLRVNGRERLACITPIAEVVRRDQPISLEPLRNFPIIGDLLVDFSSFMTNLDTIDMPLVRQAEGSMPIRHGYVRFENCIECGLCVSACPIVGTDPLYIGPAALAAAWRSIEGQHLSRVSHLLRLANEEHAVWRCHAAFECTEVCPAEVNPAGAIMAIRRFLIGGKRL